MGHSTTFFATRRDSLDLLLALERRSPLYYVRWGCYASRRDVPRYHTASDIPDLGTAEYGRQGDNRYLVLPDKAALSYYRSVHVKYGAEYTPRSRGLSPYVFFHSGGVYRGECVIAGELETAFDTREATAFYNRFKRAFRARFTLVKDPWRGGGADLAIGPEALGLLRGGMRFATDYTRTPEYDYNDKLDGGLWPAEPGAASDPAAVSEVPRSSHPAGG